MKLRYSARTDVGKKREINEDSYGPSDLPQEGAAGQLMVVCDGMGGHAAGEVASSLGVDTILSTYYATDGADRAEVLRLAFEQANQRIFEQGHGTMGTTGVAALLYNDTLYIANVGDSRAYRVHSGQLEQVSRDHSYVSEQVQAGLLTPEQARTSLVRNIITRALGHQPEVKVDIFTIPITEGDMVILSSDGMHGLVEDNEIQQAVTHLPPEKATAALINLANQRGGVDNITVIVALVERMNGATVYDGTTHTLPAINASEAPTDRVPAAPIAPTEAPTIPPTHSRAHTPTDKFPTILGQQAVQRVDQPPPAATSAASTNPPATPLRSPAAAPVERQASGMGVALATLLLLVLVGVGSWVWLNGFQSTVAPAITATPPVAATNQPSMTAPATATSAPSATTAPTTQPSVRATTQPTAQATSNTTGGSAATSAATSATVGATNSVATTRTPQAQAPVQNISQPATNSATVNPQRVISTTRPARTATRTSSATSAAPTTPSEVAYSPTATIEPPSPTVAQSNDFPSEAENLLRTAIAAATSAAVLPIPTIGQ